MLIWTSWGLRLKLTSRALDPGFGWVPACCPACGADSPRPVSALFARYFPEVGLDLHIHLVRGGHRITQVDYSVMNLKGELRAIEKPQDCIMFADTFGVPPQYPFALELPDRSTHVRTVDRPVPGSTWLLFRGATLR